MLKVKKLKLWKLGLNLQMICFLEKWPSNVRVYGKMASKMKSIGIIGRTENWIKAFLSGRIQRVRVEAELSSWKSVRSGMPQGSVLGPTLFVIFINDMPDVVRSMCQLFADDAKIFRSIKSLDDNKALQDDINNLTEWSARWQLPLNVTKCKSLHMFMR